MCSQDWKAEISLQSQEEPGLPSNRNDSGTGNSRILSCDASHRLYSADGLLHVILGRSGFRELVPKNADTMTTVTTMSNKRPLSLTQDSCVSCRHSSNCGRLILKFARREKALRPSTVDDKYVLLLLSEMHLSLVTDLFLLLATKSSD